MNMLAYIAGGLVLAAILLVTLGAMRVSGQCSERERFEEFARRCNQKD